MRTTAHTFVFCANGPSGIGINNWSSCSNPQVWVLRDDGTLISRWKPSADPTDAWVDWQQFPTPPSGKLVGICATGLSNAFLDLRAILFGVTDDGQIFTCVGGAQVFTPWAAMDAPSGIRFKEISAAQDAGGRPYLWAIDTNSSVWFRFKPAFGQPDSAWDHWVAW